MIGDSTEFRGSSKSNNGSVSKRDHAKRYYQDEIMTGRLASTIGKDLEYGLCDHCKEKEAFDMVCMDDHEDCEYLCDDCYVTMVNKVIPDE